MIRWIASSTTDGDVAFRLGRDGDELVAHWVGLCTLRSDRHGARFELTAERGADPKIVAKVRNGLAAALIRQLGGGLSLHAAAVAGERGALAFVGSSGAGKSTAAAHLCNRHARALLADDVLALELGTAGALALPTEREHWLDAPARAALGDAGAPTGGELDKEAVAAERTACRAVPLKAIVSLSFDPALDPSRAPALVPLRGAEIVARLMPSIVRFVVDEPDEIIADIARMDRLRAVVPLLELRAPRTWRALDAAAALFASLLDGGNDT